MPVSVPAAVQETGYAPSYEVRSRLIRGVTQPGTQATMVVSAGSRSVSAPTSGNKPARHLERPTASRWRLEKSAVLKAGRSVTAP